MPCAFPSTNSAALTFISKKKPALAGFFLQRTEEPKSQDPRSEEPIVVLWVPWAEGLVLGIWFLDLPFKEPRAKSRRTNYHAFDPLGQEAWFLVLGSWSFLAKEPRARIRRSNSQAYDPHGQEAWFLALGSWNFSLKALLSPVSLLPPPRLPLYPPKKNHNPVPNTAPHSEKKQPFREK